MLVHKYVSIYIYMCVYVCGMDIYIHIDYIFTFKQVMPLLLWADHHLRL